jgi:uncharacterized membrane protein YbhN (UPF0104 family)
MAADSSRQRASFAFSLILGLSVVGLFLFYRQEVFDAFRGIRIPWILLGLACFLVNYVCRAARIHLLTQKQIAVFPDGVYCCSLHGFTTYMLPVRAGELSLPFILNTVAKIEIKDGVKILYKARMLDVVVLGFWLLMAAMLPDSSLPAVYRYAMGLMGLAMALFSIVLRNLSSRILVHFSWLRKLAMAVAEHSTFNKTELLLSVFVWVASAAMLWCITAALHLHLSVDELLFLVGIQLAMQLFPLQGFANSGNHEGGWVAAMMAIGYTAEVALKFALASHFIILVFVLLLGLLAILLRCFDFR